MWWGGSFDSFVIQTAEGISSMQKETTLQEVWSLIKEGEGTDKSAFIYRQLPSTTRWTTKILLFIIYRFFSPSTMSVILTVEKWNSLAIPFRTVQTWLHYFLSAIVCYISDKYFPLKNSSFLSDHCRWEWRGNWCTKAKSYPIPSFFSQAFHDSCQTQLLRAGLQGSSHRLFMSV